MSLRVLFVTQWFPPEPYLLPLDIATSLAAADCEVTVLTGIPNYPSGQVMPGYSAWRGLTEEIGGLRVIRAPLFPSHDLSGAKRALNYLSFGTASAARALSPRTQVDVSLVFSSPITAAIPATAGSFLRRIPYVMMVQDLWPNVVYESGLLGSGDHPWARRVLDASCLNIYRRASTCFAITPGMCSDLIAMGVPPEKVEPFWNWGPAEGKDAGEPTTDLRTRIGAGKNELVLVYAGNMGSTHALDAWVTAVAAREHNSPNDRGVHLVFLGDGVVRPELEALAQREGSSTTHFLGRMDDETFLAYRNSADANIVSLIPSPVFDTSMPSKIPDTLAHGGLLIGAVRGDAADLISESGGIVAADTSTESIGYAIDSLAKMPSNELAARRARGKALYDERMSRTVGTAALMRALRAAADSRVRSRS